MPFRTVEGNTHLCLVSNPGTAEETIDFVFAGGDGSDKANAVQVTTFEELMNANADAEMSGKYIKVMNNINIGNESWYTGSISTITWKNYIFADTSKTIEGVVVVGQNFLRNNTPMITFENINWLNCVHKVEGTTLLGTLYGNNGSNYINWINCMISIRVLTNGKANSLSVINTYNKFTDCSVYIQNATKESTAMPSIMSFSQATMIQTRSNFIFDNFKTSGYGNTGSSLLGLYTSSCSIIFKNCDFTQSGILNDQNNTSYAHTIQTYFAFSNCTFAASPLTVTSNRLAVVASDADTSLTGSNYPFVIGTGSGVLATMVDSTDPNFDTQSIKSKQFLLNCGFLP